MSNAAVGSRAPPGVLDQGVDPTPPLEYRVDGRTDLGGVAHVDLVRHGVTLAQRPDRREGGVTIQVEDLDPGAGGGEPPGARRTEPVAGPSDDGDPTGEASAHTDPWVGWSAEICTSASSARSPSRASVSEPRGCCMTVSG